MKTKTMNKGIIGFIISSTLILSSCGADQDQVVDEMNAVQKDSTLTEAPVVDAHTSQNSLDWEGNYSGTLPCADCEGIETKITLKNDQEYEVVQSYLGKEDSAIVSAGKFKWVDDGASIELPESKVKYKVVENGLKLLNLRGEVIDSDMEAKYLLVKREIKLEGAKWELVEFMGQEVTDSMTKTFPNLTFDAEKERAYGSASCNTFSSHYTSDGQFKLSFNQTISSKKACLDANIEKEFLQMLAKVDNFVITDDYLALSKGKMAPIARFKAIEK